MVCVFAALLATAGLAQPVDFDPNHGIAVFTGKAPELRLDKSDCKVRVSVPPNARITVMLPMSRELKWVEIVGKKEVTPKIVAYDLNKMLLTIVIDAKDGTPTLSLQDKNGHEVDRWYCVVSVSAPPVPDKP